MDPNIVESVAYEQGKREGDQVGYERGVVSGIKNAYDLIHEHMLKLSRELAKLNEAKVDANDSAQVTNTLSTQIDTIQKLKSLIRQHGHTGRI